MSLTEALAMYSNSVSVTETEGDTKMRAWSPCSVVQIPRISFQNLLLKSHKIAKIIVHKIS
jgi:hypothetical protein